MRRTCWERKQDKRVKICGHDWGDEDRDGREVEEERVAVSKVKRGSVQLSKSCSHPLNGGCDGRWYSNRIRDGQIKRSALSLGAFQSAIRSPCRARQIKPLLYSEPGGLPSYLEQQQRDRKSMASLENTEDTTREAVCINLQLQLTCLSKLYKRVSSAKRNQISAYWF